MNMKKSCLLYLLLALLFFGCKGSTELVITNVNIIDVQSGLVIENQYILISDDLIIEHAAMDAYAGSIENGLDDRGMYVSPGLTDGDIYAGKNINDVKLWDTHFCDRLIARGVTTVRLTGSYYRIYEMLTDYGTIAGKDTIGPNFIESVVANYSLGNNIEGLNELYESGNAAFIKVLANIPEEQLSNIMRYADENGIYICGNLFNFGDFQRVSGQGFDELASIRLLPLMLLDDEYADDINWFDMKESYAKLEQYFSAYYGFTDEELIDQFGTRLTAAAALMKEHDIAVTTNLSVDQLWAMKADHPERYLEYAEANGVPSYYLLFLDEKVAGDSFRVENYPEQLSFQYRIDLLALQILKEKGIKLIAGSFQFHNCMYGQAPGISLHEELRLLVEAGYSDLEALKSATSVPSAISEDSSLGFSYGRIEEGCIADLVFTSGNPLEDISVLREPDMVIKSGLVYDSLLLKTLRE